MLTHVALAVIFDRGTPKPVTAEGIDVVVAVPDSATRAHSTQFEFREAAAPVLTTVSGPSDHEEGSVLLSPTTQHSTILDRMVVLGSTPVKPVVVPTASSSHMRMLRIWRRVTLLNGFVHIGVLLVRQPQPSRQLSVLGQIKVFQITRPSLLNVAWVRRSFLSKLLLHLFMTQLWLLLIVTPLFVCLVHSRLPLLFLQGVSRPALLSRFLTEAPCSMFVIFLPIAMPCLPSSTTNLFSARNW